MNNPIPRAPALWSADMTLDDIEAFIQRLPKSQQANAYHVMMWTLNAAHGMVEQELEQYTVG
jgi:hypothetical protein